MYPHKKLTIWTLITNFLIVITGGHGIATLGLMEIFIFEITKLTPQNLLFVLSAAITFMGQIALIISLFSQPPRSTYLKFIGTSVLFVGYLFLLARLWNKPEIGVSLFTAIPFLILVVLLFFKNLQAYKEQAIKSAEKNLL